MEITLLPKKGFEQVYGGIFTEDQVPCFKVHFRETAAAWIISSCVWYKLLKRKKKKVVDIYMKFLNHFFTFKSKAAYVLDLYLAIPCRRK